ncbi:MAG: hypothetical protein ACHQZR_01545 [Candidatus Limnocylindrales bacterium]
MSLVFDQLRKRFGRTQALDGISFSVPRGEVFGFLGANGAAALLHSAGVLMYGQRPSMRRLFAVLRQGS